MRLHPKTFEDREKNSVEVEKTQIKRERDRPKEIEKEGGRVREPTTPRQRSGSTENG